MRTIVLVLLLVLTACSAAEPAAEPAADGQPGVQATQTTAPSAPAADPPTTTQPEGGRPREPIPPAYGSDGNSVADVAGPFGTQPDRLRNLERTVVRVDLPTDDVVAATYDNGEVRLIDEARSEMRVRSTPGPTGVVYTDGPAGADILEALPDQAPHSRPAVLRSGQIAYVTESGDLVVWDGSEIGRVEIDALPDGDVLVDDKGRLLVLTGPTERYAHGILGDRVEASGFAIVEPPSLEVAVTVSIEPPAAIEARRAMWADLDGDGAREVQVTVSDPAGGARLVAFRESGVIAFAGPAIGLGNRWRHQVAYGNFGDGNFGVEVITPHIGGVVSFIEYGPDMSDVASTSGFTSHAIGSRELDGAVAIDVDGDGRLELMVPTQDRRRLVAIGLRDGDAEVVWSSDLESPMTSNIAVGIRSGAPTIAIGTADGTIYLWSTSS